MSISSDLKLISDVARRLSVELEYSPSGSISFEALNSWCDMMIYVDLVKRSLNALAVCLPADDEGNGTCGCEEDLLGSPAEWDILPMNFTPSTWSNEVGS